MAKPHLELVWINKDHRPKLEPRILVEDTARGWRRPGIADNRLIFGDNLLALRALEQEFAGRVKCCFIDPPYNTGSAFAHYDDGMEHSLWLSLMRDRLEIIRRLLSDDGSLWITIDDNEAHYLKVLCDEVFGRANFVANVVWQKKSSPQANATWLSDSHDHLLVFSKNKERWRPKLLPRSEAAVSRYRNPDDDARGVWTSGDCTISLTGGQRGAQFARTGVSENIYEIATPTGRKVTPPAGTCWRFSEERFAELVADRRIWFGADGANVPRVKRFLSEVQDGVVSVTWWTRDEVGDNQEAKREVIAFNREKPFATPKPERLIKRVLEIATNPGDLVLDSFAGSGTTGAVAHKMGRRWIMVELGEHCHTHIIPRLRKVIDGEDEGGVTGATGWKGGGGFRYFRLGPSLLTIDAHGREVVSNRLTSRMLAEAVCKLEGFAYAPNETVWWQHGHSTEGAFIYVTPATLTRDDLAVLSDAVGEDRTLVVVCRAFRGAGAFANLDVRKIPNSLRARCDWDRDDYSLAIPPPPTAVAGGRGAGPLRR